VDFQPGVYRVQYELVHAELHAVALSQIEHAEGDRLPRGKRVEINAVAHGLGFDVAGADNPGIIPIRFLKGNFKERKLGHALDLFGNFLQLSKGCIQGFLNRFDRLEQ
jgi:hypothetical protein